MLWKSKPNEYKFHAPGLRKYPCKKCHKNKIVIASDVLYKKGYISLSTKKALFLCDTCFEYIYLRQQR